MRKQRQPPYNMEKIVSKGSETVYLTILNHISFEAELHLDCIQAFQNIINAIFPPQTSFLWIPYVHKKLVCSSMRQPPNDMFVSKRMLYRKALRPIILPYQIIYHLKQNYM